MNAAVVLDDWKLPIFERHLREAGFSWTQHPGMTADTIMLKVTCEFVSTLEPIVRAANDEARASRAT